MNKCNFYFESQYVYIDGKAIHVSEYIEKEMQKHTSKLCCIKGHEVILVNGQKNKSHFRHKHSYDVVVSPMSEWHVEWQSNFPVTEVSYPIINEAQSMNRRADVVIEEYNRIIELQHSKIERNEVINRNRDYKLHNKEVLWIIDGGSINVRHLVHSNRYYLDFTSNFWKYERFLDCDFIYLDIESQIYKINPKNVKSHMIDVYPPFSKQEFIESLKNGKELWGEDESVQCNLYIKQQGAGNGKTYGIIQNIIAPEFAHYDFFIFVTKAHSAKTIINKEFKDQFEEYKLNGLAIDSFEYTKTNKYVIKCHNIENGSKKLIIMGTIDSLMYTLGNKEHHGLDMFEGIINSIIDDHIETKNNAGLINYGAYFKLNKNTCLFVDEMQDLTPDYAKAILQIMRNRYIDVYAVGDKLQSITHNKNAFVYLIENDFSNIKKTVYPFTNICRRFIHPALVNFVNTMIPFAKYNLPEITPYMKNENNDTNVLQFIEGQPIYQGHTDVNLLQEETKKIMRYYINEVEENNRLPNDFLFVTPFTKKNALMDALQLAITTYWQSRNTEDEYQIYAIFHKSEDGTSIDLKESDNATRMVSIHTSKGDGRNVVFVIGITEQSLKKFSEESENLIYHSLLHVSITRMEQKLYIRYENNGDNISQKIQKYIYDNLENIDIVPNLLIFNSVKFNEITNDSNEQYEFFYENIIQNTNIFRLFREEEQNDKKIIDMSHHNIRYMSLLINLFLNIISKENTDKNSKEDTDKSEIKKQILAIFHKIKDAKIIETDTWQDYYKILSENNKNIPIHKICNQGRDYKKYFGIIKEFIKNIQIKLKDIVVLNKLVSLCPYECVILNYMIQIYDQRAYSDISITELYNITDIYDKSFDSSYQGHENCLCSKCFNNNSITNDETNTYLLKHYENLIKINHIYIDFCNKYPKMNWLINGHVVKHDGMNDNFKIWKKMNLIGYDDDNVIISYVKPQLNALNYNSILLESIYDTYLIHNIKKYDDNDETQMICENYKRFFGKKITIAIFTLDSETPYYIHWSNKLDKNENLVKKQNDYIKKEILAKSLIDKMTIDCKYLYFFYNYYRRKCSEKGMNISIDIIEEIIAKYDKNKEKNETPNRKFPKLIDEFFNDIKSSIKKSNKKERKQILLDYDNKEYFNEKLNEIIKCSINRFLNIKDDSEDDDEEEDDENSNPK